MRLNIALRGVRWNNIGPGFPVQDKITWLKNTFIVIARLVSIPG